MFKLKVDLSIFWRSQLSRARLSLVFGKNVRAIGQPKTIKKAVGRSPRLSPICGEVGVAGEVETALFNRETSLFCLNPEFKALFNSCSSNYPTYDLFIPLKIHIFNHE